MKTYPLFAHNSKVDSLFSRVHPFFAILVQTHVWIIIEKIVEKKAGVNGPLNQVISVTYHLKTDNLLLPIAQSVSLIPSV